MAKAPKKRTKKGSTLDFKRRELDAIVNHCYQRVKFLGDNWHTPRACGIQKLYTHLKGAYHDVGMENFLRHLMREVDWSLNVSCFFKDKEDGELIHVAQAFALFQDVVMEEVSANLSAVIIEAINLCLEADERFNNESMIYYTYVLYPEFHPSYDTVGDGLSELMINLDDVSTFDTFNDKLPGHPSSVGTLPQAIKDNGIFPRIKNQIFWPDELEVISDDTSFLQQRQKTEVVCETL